MPKELNWLPALFLLPRGEFWAGNRGVGWFSRREDAIRDEASQLVAALVGHGKSVLDCCAAPGGKTLAIADRNANAQIAAVDLHAHRARLLRRLLHAQNFSNEAGDRNVGVVAADARHLPFVASFERVLADVPCLGHGHSFP